MIYLMNLANKPFELIKSKRKVIEMRLNDSRRKNIKENDLITFTNNETNEHLLVKVKNITVYKSFVELYQDIDKSKLGYSENEIADPKDMNLYYSDENIEKYGVIAIEIDYFDDIEIKLLYECNDEIYNLRSEVFMKEQGFLTDKDEIDDDCVYYCMYKKGKLIATIRIFELNETTYGLGRFCLVKENRGSGFGAVLLKLAEKYVKDNLGTTVFITAECVAYDFYVAYGYEATSSPYYLDDIKHVDMIKHLE